MTISSVMREVRQWAKERGLSALVPAVIVAGLLTSCGKDHARLIGSESPDRNWFIESYDNGVITVRHEGNRYTGTCDVSRSFNNAISATDPNNVAEFATCYLAVEFVGHSVQPFEGKQKDASGWTVNMWNVGPTLALRRWRDEKTPWQQEEYKITSVRNSRE